MSSNLDQELLAFLLGELGVLKRLDVRVRLGVSKSARRRLAELEHAAGAIAGTLGVGGVAGFRANQRLKQRRLLLLDLAVAVALLSSVGAGATIVWRTLHPAPADCNVAPATVATREAPMKLGIQLTHAWTPTDGCASGGLASAAAKPAIKSEMPAPRIKRVPTPF
jgi:hypothetical protein